MNCRFPAFLGFLIAIGSMVPAEAVLISEFSPVQKFQAGEPPIPRDRQIFELSGIRNMDFSGFLLAIGGEQGRFGTIDSAQSIMGRFNDNGILAIELDDVLDPTATFVLTSSFTRAVGFDIDDNDDGVINVNADFGLVLDAIGVAGPSNDPVPRRLYGSQLGGQDFALSVVRPQQIFRDGSFGDALFAVDRLSPGSAIFNTAGVDVSQVLNFDKDPFTDTFNAINPTARVTAVPEPSSLVALLGIAGVAARKYRRRTIAAARI